MSGANPNSLWAETFIDGLAHGGVRHVALAPGSRSIPLVLAAAAHPDIRLYTHLDERAAAFFALGVAKGCGGTGTVITTSGTAAANLYPAVIEAAHGETPLLLLTADRPGYLRGTDANQTIDQQRLFGSYPRAFFDAGLPSRSDAALGAHRALAGRALAAARGPVPGPVHVNFPFAKPLEPVPRAPRSAAAPSPTLHRAQRTAGAETVADVAGAVRRSTRVLLVAGPARDPFESGPAILRLAAHLGVPVVADPLSGARFAPTAADWALDAYDAYLQAPAVRRALAPDCILRFGAACTSSAVNDFLASRAGTRQIVVDDGWGWKDHTASASDHVPAEPTGFAKALMEAAPPRPAGDWTVRWREVDRRARTVMARAGTESTFDGTALAALVAGVPPRTRLFVGNSMPVRDVDRYGSARDAELRVCANRGASGIDGLVSTAAGVAAGSGEAVVAVLGDVSFLHDLGGMHIVRAERLPLVLVVVNNDGGGIFHHLPVRGHEPAFTRHVVAPHGIDLARAAAVYDVTHHCLPIDADLASAVADAIRQGGPTLIELRTDRERARARREADVQAVAAEVRSVLAVGDDR